MTLALVFPLAGLSGCIVDRVPDNYVYFNNKTDQTLYVRVRDLLGGKAQRLPLEPNQTSDILLVPENECADLWVVVDRDDRVVKDPGRICWHDTVTIP